MITKRLLGLILIALGFLVLTASLGADLVSAGQSSGFGPVQQRLVIGSILTMIVGASLWPLGDRPA